MHKEIKEILERKIIDSDKLKEILDLPADRMDAKAIITAINSMPHYRLIPVSDYVFLIEDFVEFKQNKHGYFEGNEEILAERKEGIIEYLRKMSAEYRAMYAPNEEKFSETHSGGKKTR